MKRLTPIYKADDQATLNKLSEMKDEIKKKVKREVSDQLGGFPEMENPEKFHDLVYKHLMNSYEYNQIELEQKRIKELIIPIDYEFI